MIAETLRMVHTALADPTYGVSAQLAGLPLDTPVGGATPDSRPALPPIRNAADNDLGVREVDDTFPLILVDIANPATAPGEIWAGVRDHEIDVMIAILAAEGDPAANVRATDYILRATVKAIGRALLANDRRDINGVRNGYVIRHSSKLRYGPAKESIHGGMIVGAVNFTLTVRELNP